MKKKFAELIRMRVVNELKEKKKLFYKNNYVNYAEKFIRQKKKLS